MKFVETITEFEKFCKLKVQELSAVKEIMGKMRDQREIEINAQRECMSQMIKFEQIAVSYFTDHNDDSLIVAHTKHDLESKLL